LNPVASIKGVIFDMDGTLISTQAVIVHCVNETSKKYLKRTLPAGDPFWTLGPPARNIIAGFAKGLPSKPVKEAVDDYLFCYRENFPDKAILFAGINRLLRRLRVSDRRLAVVTAEERGLMEFNLATLGVKEYFDILVSRDDVLKPKPDPEGIHRALRTMKTNPEESIMIGDAPTDILAGKNAGLITGLTTWASQFRGDLAMATPDYEFHTVEQLAKFFS
jgi:phosphoglycolate phosphatase/pyrophosphatase PpaX